MQSDGGDALIMSKYLSSLKDRKRHDDMINGEDMDETAMPSLDDDLDPETKMKGIQLELQRLKVQEQSMMLQQQLLQLEAARKKNVGVTQSIASNRCILPDGRIVVRNVNDRNLESRDVEGSFAAGAGDSLTIPALQRVASRACVACGSAADSYCSRCGLTPYCSSRCQRLDWAERHRAVCHNLAKLSAAKPDTEANAAEDIEITPPTAPLRRPHSPKRDAQRYDDSGSDRGHKNAQQKNTPMQNNNRQGRSFNQGQRNFNRPGDRAQRDRSQGDRAPRDRSQGDRAPRDRSQGDRTGQGDRFQGNRQGDRTQGSNNRQYGNRQGNANQGQRPPLRHENQNGHDNWDNKNKPAQATPVAVPTSTPPAEQPKPAPKEAEPPKPKVNGYKPPGNLEGATPKKVVPKNCIIDLLKIGLTPVLMPESSVPSGLLCLCLCMSESFEREYEKLCAIQADGELAGPPSPGDLVAYLNPSDDAWYRARVLSPTKMMLIDAGKMVPITDKCQLKPLPAKYEQIPEFTCLLKGPGIEAGQNYNGTLVSSIPGGFKVSLRNVDTGASAGEGEITRFVPEIEEPKPKPQAASLSPSAATPPPIVVPEVPRPDLTNNSTVFLVDAMSLERAFVRPVDMASQKLYDTVLQDTVLYGRSATPLTEPPIVGQVVIALYEDGLHYRALCQRKNVQKNRYLLEYIDFGNTGVTSLEKLYPCPPNLDLSAQPAIASLVTLECGYKGEFTDPAVQYLENLKDNAVELTLTLTSGTKTAPSGASVHLKVVKSNESVNKKLEEMCLPEWKQMEQRGQDVMDSPTLLYRDMACQELPAAGCTIQVLDVDAFSSGSVSGCIMGTHKLDRLNDQMAAYCSSEIGKEPYLPKFEELCIVRSPTKPLWCRAVLLEQLPGSKLAKVCFMDYGSVLVVPVETLRKMLPEFARVPAMASHLDITDFPEKPTSEQIDRAMKHMKMKEGRGELIVTKCEMKEPGLYTVEAPGLLSAMGV